ncbi:MAG: hypothetical protein VB119_12780 [Candidatus Metalachnospira sp.]|nr:hypothetical protein [Candidatus Metalachnospira sp.]
MKAEEIEGITPKQIQNKFVLPQVPKYVCDANIPAKTTIRCGIVGPQTEFGGLGGGVKFDLMQQMVGTFTNSRLLP